MFFICYVFPFSILRKRHEGLEERPLARFEEFR